MTMTVKLDPALELRLRECAAAQGLPASDIIRQALLAFLAEKEQAPASSFSLGAELFGRHAGPADLAIKRKQAAADVWADKHASRRN
jgi:hypothetical protein